MFGISNVEMTKKDLLIVIFRTVLYVSAIITWGILILWLIEPFNINWRYILAALLLLVPISIPIVGNFYEYDKKWNPTKYQPTKPV